MNSSILDIETRIASLSPFTPGSVVAFTRNNREWSVRRWPDGIEVHYRPKGSVHGTPWDILGCYQSAETTLRAIYAELENPR